MKAMKVEGLLFSGIAAFVAACTIVYWFTSKEVTGTTCLALTSSMSLLMGYYFLNTARRFDARPEDKPITTVDDGAGTVGHFSAGSYWPVGMALGGSMMLAGIAIGPWLSIIGAVILITFVSGLILEHYQGEPLQMIELVESGAIDMTPGDGHH